MWLKRLSAGEQGDVIKVELHGLILAWYCNKCKTNLDLLLFPGFGFINTVQTIANLSLNHLEYLMIKPELDGPTLNRLHDQAKMEAQRLRQQAVRDFGSETVDDFWRGANAIWQRGQATAQSSAVRLRARLARRALSRITPPSTLTTGA
jgi:hypothetical protein